MYIVASKKPRMRSQCLLFLAGLDEKTKVFLQFFLPATELNLPCQLQDLNAHYLRHIGPHCVRKCLQNTQVGEIKTCVFHVNARRETNFT